MARDRESNAQMKAPSRLILEAYHGHEQVYSLLDYVLDITDTSGCRTFAKIPDSQRHQFCRDHLLKDLDPPAYRDLLTKSLVAGVAVKGNSVRPGTKVKISEHSSSMIEVIDRAHTRLFSRNRKPTNVIAAGYRLAEFRAEIGKAGAGGARPGVTNFFVNTLVTALQASEWCLLLKRVGDAILLHLLTETSVFIALPNDCYCQLTGPALNSLAPPHSIHDVMPLEKGAEAGQLSRKRKARDFDSARPLKRLRKDVEDNQVPVSGKAATKLTTSRTAATISIARVTMFYARPQRRAKSGQIYLGLPPDYILNRMKTRNWRASNRLLEDVSHAEADVRPADRNGAFEARHLSKYIFPMQYNLENVFSIHSERLRNEQFMRFRFMNREDEIKRKGTSKTPSRLKATLPLLAQLYNRHTKCGYKVLLNDLCPSKLRPIHREATADKSVILELVSEDISEDFLRTQMQLTMSDSMPYSFSAGGRRNISSRSTSVSALKQASQAKLKPKFAEYTCGLAEVYLYVCAITRRVIPHELWGSESNRKIIFHHVKQLISGRRYEGFTIHNVMQGISTSECDWLLPSGKPSQSHVQSEGEMLKRRQLLQEFVFWYFDQFLLPLLRTTFYITDSSAFRNRVLYFRQDDWDVLCRPLFDRLMATTFEPIDRHEADQLLKKRKLGYSFVRLLPKDSGVRPIVNLRRKIKVISDNPYDQGQSINQILSATFEILRYEKMKQEERLGASVFGPDETYLRLKEFKQRVVGSSGELPKLYFVKLDVQACFDTIEQHKLLGILKDLITEDVYMIQKFGQIVPATGRPQRRFVRNAMPEHEHPHFLTYAVQLAALLRNALLIDQAVYPFAFRDEITQLLEDHITANIVKIGNDYYRQRVGIPQGSVLSSLLCSFFYGDLESSKLRFVTDSTRQNVLLRLIDDYLFITTDLQDARHFLEVMNEGHPEYGCFIARDKTLTNFQHDVGDISQHNLSTVMHPDRKFFPWCGYLINVEDLSITTDYSRFHTSYIKDSLTVERTRRPNAAFVQKMLQASRAKSHVIFTDTTHNSTRAVRANVYQALVLVAMKMHAYIREARESAGGLAFIPQATRSSESNTSETSTMIVKRGYGSVKGRKNARGAGAFLLRTIRRCIRYTFASIRAKESRRIARKAGWSSDLSKDEVLWLGTHAFHSVLSIKRTAYTHAGVLGALQRDLVHPRYHSMKRRLGGIAKESLQDMLRDIRF